MFRRLSGKQPPKEAPKSFPPVLPLGDAAAMWYKPAASPSPAADNNAFTSPSNHDNGGAAESPRRHHAQQRSPVPLHQPATVPFPPPNNINHHQQAATLTNSQHHRNSNQQHPNSPRKANRDSSSSTHDTTATVQLIALILMGNDWGAAGQCIDREPKCVRFKESMSLLGHTTVAYPLHAAVVMHPPMPFLEKLCDAFPIAAQMADEGFGRMPLHWACIANAPAKSIEKLIKLFPSGSKVMDKAQGRLPLHYIVSYATDIRQVIAVLDAEPRGVKTKDKQSKTPVDLAHASSNPLKIDILAELRKKRSVHKPKPTAVRASEEKADMDTSWDFSGHEISAETLVLKSQVETGGAGGSDINNNHRSKPPMSGGFLFHHRRPRGEEHQKEQDAPPKPFITGARGAPPHNHYPSVDSYPVESAGAGGSRNRKEEHVVLPPMDLRGYDATFSASDDRDRRGSAPGLKPPPTQSPPDGAASARDRRGSNPVLKPPPEPSKPDVGRVTTQHHRQQHPPLHHQTQHMPGAYQVRIDNEQLMTPPPEQPPQDVGRVTTQQHPPLHHQTQHMPGAYHVRNDDENQMSQNALKLQSYAGQESLVANIRATGGSNLTGNMNDSIKSLKDQIAQYGRDRRQKGIELAELDQKLGEVQYKEQEAARELVRNTKAQEESALILEQKHSLVARMRQQIAELEKSLQEEEASIQTLSGALASFSKSAEKAETILKKYQSDKGNLVTVRGVLEEEKAMIDRSISNCESELKSLEAFQRMVRDGDR